MTLSTMLSRAAGLTLNTMAVVAPRSARRLAIYLWFTPFPFARRGREQIPEGASPVSLDTARGVVRGYEMGRGDRVALLVHGWAGSSVQYRHLARRLADVGYRAVAIDLPAHGHLAGLQTDVYEMADAIEASVRSLGTVRLVVAHSLGAMAASIALRNGLAVERVALISPGVRPAHALGVLVDRMSLSRRVAGYIEQEMKRRFGDDVWTRVTDELMKQRVGADVVIIHGGRDVLVETDDVVDLAEAWQAPMVLSPESDHNGVLRAVDTAGMLLEFATGSAQTAA